MVTFVTHVVRKMGNKLQRESIECQASWGWTSDDIFISAAAWQTGSTASSPSSILDGKLKCFIHCLFFVFLALWGCGKLTWNGKKMGRMTPCCSQPSCLIVTFEDSPQIIIHSPFSCAGIHYVFFWVFSATQMCYYSSVLKWWSYSYLFFKWCFNFSIAFAIHVNKKPWLWLICNTVKTPGSGVQQQGTAKISSGLPWHTEVYNVFPGKRLLDEQRRRIRVGTICVACVFVFLFFKFQP